VLEEGPAHERRPEDVPGEVAAGGRRVGDQQVGAEVQQDERRARQRDRQVDRAEAALPFRFRLRRRRRAGGPAPSFERARAQQLLQCRDAS
jgi:hypothetical protein